MRGILRAVLSRAGRTKALDTGPGLRLTANTRNVLQHSLMKTTYLRSTVPHEPDPQAGNLCWRWKEHSGHRKLRPTRNYKHPAWHILQATVGMAAYLHRGTRWWRRAQVSIRY